MSQETKLARLAIRNYLKKDQVIEPPQWVEKKLLTKKAGVFVSLFKEGQLRGCIGTIEPTCENIASEIIKNAISSACRDPRFNPLKKSELNKIKIEVSILKKPQAINSTDKLDPKKYGLIIKKGPKKGLLLPKVEGISSKQDQLSITARKAGINDLKNCQLYRFEVDNYKEK